MDGGSIPPGSTTSGWESGSPLIAITSRLYRLDHARGALLLAALRASQPPHNIFEACIPTCEVRQRLRLAPSDVPTGAPQINRVLPEVVG
jgi:hypothetical protein